MRYKLSTSPGNGMPPLESETATGALRIYDQLDGDITIRRNGVKISYADLKADAAVEGLVRAQNP